MLAQERYELAGEQPLVIARLEKALHGLFVPRPAVDLPGHLIDLAAEIRRHGLQHAQQEMPQQFMGIAGPGPRVVVHERRPDQEVFQGSLLPGGYLRQLLCTDAVECRRAQQQLLLPAGDLPPEELVEQPVHVLKLRQLVRALLQVSQIQGHRDGPALRVAVDGVQLMPVQAEAQLLSVAQDVPFAEQEVPGIEAGHAGGALENSPQLFEVLRDEHDVQPVLVAVSQSLQKGQRPVVADQLKVVQDEIAGLRYREPGQDVRSIAHIAAVEKTQLPQGVPRRGIQAAYLTDEPVQTGVLLKAHRGEPADLFGRQLLHRPAHRRALPVAGGSLDHGEAAPVYA